MRSLLVAILLLQAGCLGASDGADAPSSSSSAPEPVAPTAAPAPAPGPEVGALAVVVLTSEMEPVGAAQVNLVGTERAALTDPAGQATFNDLAPGEYTVAAAKPGFRARQEEGRVVAIAAGNTTELRLVLDPVAIVTPETSYVEVLILRGFIACSVDSYSSVATNVGGPTQYCGRGVTANGQTVRRDPNDNSTHVWAIKNPQAEAWWLEAQWTPSAQGLSPGLFFTQQGNYACQVTCSSSQFFSSGGGPSPYRVLVQEGELKNITKAFGTDPAKYPRTVFTLVKGFCTAPCVTLTLNQKYDIFTSVFYGQDPPAEYTALPP